MDANLSLRTTTALPSLKNNVEQNKRAFSEKHFETFCGFFIPKPFISLKTQIYCLKSIVRPETQI